MQVYCMFDYYELLASTGRALYVVASYSKRFTQIAHVFGTLSALW